MSDKPTRTSGMTASLDMDCVSRDILPSDSGSIKTNIHIAKPIAIK